ncbi:hypothetical protein LBMAG55_17090 [Verrucomicrobiota bacterium]|nr:hypothetical protein LBMAG55_17090 [Verrucomicrobiota bacterium]
MTSGLLLLAAMLAALTPNARKGDPCAAESWRADPAQYEGKPVKTAVLGVEEPGLVTSDAPAAAVRILTGNEKEEAGGAIIVLLPLEKFQAFVANFSSRQLGANRSGFGALSKAKVVAGTYGTVKGEGVLLYELDPKTAKELGKPSEILATQLKTVNPATEPTRPGWTRQEFNLAKLSALGAPETTREWERLQALLLAKAGKDKSQRRKASELIAGAKTGEGFKIEDETAKVEWTLVWR